MTTADGGGQDLTLAALARQLQKVRDTLATQQTRLAAHKGWLEMIDRRLAAAGLDDLAARFDTLAATVAATLEAASPRGPAVPRWDRLDAGERASQLRDLREWVDGVLRPAYVAGSGYTLAACWDQHEIVLWELSAVAAQWRHIYGRERPGPVTAALEWNDRWLPGAMRRVTEATANCNLQHIG